MELTREQRLEIYKLARDIYIKRFRARHGICLSINEAMFDVYGEYDLSKDIVDLFPELKSVMPKDAKQFSLWWPVFDMESRIKAFDRMIELASK